MWTIIVHFIDKIIFHEQRFRYRRSALRSLLKRKYMLSDSPIAEFALFQRRNAKISLTLYKNWCFLQAVCGDKYLLSSADITKMQNFVIVGSTAHPFNHMRTGSLGAAAHSSKNQATTKITSHRPVDDNPKKDGFSIHIHTRSDLFCAALQVINPRNLRDFNFNLAITQEVTMLFHDIVTDRKSVEYFPDSQ